eukprot:IDg9037t1
MWAPPITRAYTRALRIAPRAHSLRVLRHSRTLCDKPPANQTDAAKAAKAGSEKSSAGTASKEAHSKYASYYVKRSGGASSSNPPARPAPAVATAEAAAEMERHGRPGCPTYSAVASLRVTCGSYRDAAATTSSAQRQVAKIEVVNEHTANVYYKDDMSRPRMRFSIGSVELLERKLERAQEDLGLEPHEFLRMSSLHDVWARGGLPGGMGGRTGGRTPSRGPFGGGGGSGNAPGRPGAGPFGGLGGSQGGIFNVGKANATVLNRDDNKVDVTFKDVAGL